MSIPAPRGIIFDFDGVIVDTEWVIYQSWVRLFAREGQEISIQTYSPCLGAGYSRWNPAEYLEQLTGKSFDWERETAERQAWLEAELARSGLMPGVRELRMARAVPFPGKGGLLYGGVRPVRDGGLPGESIAIPPRR